MHALVLALALSAADAPTRDAGLDPIARRAQLVSEIQQERSHRPSIRLSLMGVWVGAGLLTAGLVAAVLDVGLNSHGDTLLSGPGAGGILVASLLGMLVGGIAAIVSGITASHVGLQRAESDARIEALEEQLRAIDTAPL